MSAGDWCLIESDPGVFSELIRGFGVTGVQVEEIYSLDKESFSELRPVHGLIFLFKFTERSTISTGRVVHSDDVFFAKQVINNACATQAILSILMNLSDPDIELGGNLKELKDFTREFDPNMRGLTISNSDVIRDVHNSFARQQIVEFDQKVTRQDEDVFHFVSYVHINGKLYELDGLQEGPIEHCTVPPGQDWLEFARPVIETRIAQYAQGEIHFNLMAVVKDRRIVTRNKIEKLQKEVAAEASKEKKEEISLQIHRLMNVISVEESKIQQYKQENIRRRHNYLPMIMEMLKILAEQGKLGDIWDQAKEKALEREQKSDKRKASAMAE